MLGIEALMRSCDQIITLIHFECLVLNLVRTFALAYSSPDSLLESNRKEMVTNHLLFMLLFDHKIYEMKSPY